jgi:predicted O-methyltransferase YrrM
MFKADIEGWMSDPELVWLFYAAASYKSVIEVGSWKGKSTFALCSGCTGTVYAVDHWLGSEQERATAQIEASLGGLHQKFLANVGHFKNLVTVIGASLEVAASERVPACEMVFIDAGHTKDEVAADIAAWSNKATHFICGHDYDWEGVAAAVTDAYGTQHVGHGPGSIWYVKLPFLGK